MNEYCSMSTDVNIMTFFTHLRQEAPLSDFEGMLPDSAGLICHRILHKNSPVLFWHCILSLTESESALATERDPARLGQVGTNGLSYTYWISRIYYSYGVQFKFSLKMSPSFIRGNNINKCRMSYSESGEHLERRKIVRGVNLYFNWVFHPPTARGLYIRKYKIISESIMGLV